MFALKILPESRRTRRFHRYILPVSVERFTRPILNIRKIKIWKTDDRQPTLRDLPTELIITEKKQITITEKKETSRLEHDHSNRATTGFNRAMIDFKTATTATADEAATGAAQAATTDFNPETIETRREIIEIRRAAMEDFSREMINLSRADASRRKDDQLDRGSRTTARASFQKCK